MTSSNNDYERANSTLFKNNVEDDDDDNNNNNNNSSTNTQPSSRMKQQSSDPSILTAQIRIDRTTGTNKFISFDHNVWNDDWSIRFEWRRCEVGSNVIARHAIASSRCRITANCIRKHLSFSSSWSDDVFCVINLFIIRRWLLSGSVVGSNCRRWRSRRKAWLEMNHFRIVSRMHWQRYCVKIGDWVAIALRKIDRSNVASLPVNNSNNDNDDDVRFVCFWVEKLEISIMKFENFRFVRITNV